MDKNTWLAIILGGLVLITGMFLVWYCQPSPPRCSLPLPLPPPLTVNIGAYLTSPPNTKTDPEHMIRMEMVSSDPKIVLLHNFLSAAECDYLIRLGESQGFDPSTVQGSTQNEVSSDRTSHTINLKRQQDATVTAIETRATYFCHFPAENIENLQIVRYQPGQQYKHHYDFFVPNVSGTQVALKRGGQRHVTFFVYLNDMVQGESGGQTDFPKLNLKIKPQKGMAVMWYNVKNNQEDFRTFHAGLPPHQSVKYGLNIWVRERMFR